MSELWLEVGPGPGGLEDRVAWWRERGEALRQHGPWELLERGASPETPEPHGQLDTWLPMSTLREDVHGALTAWFSADMERLGIDLTQGWLGTARSWLDVMALPSAQTTGGGKPRPCPADWLGRLADPRLAHDLAFELFAPPRLGAALGRYPEQLAALVAAAPAGDLSVWDAGCATGEGTWELAGGLSRAGRQVHALGTTPWPLERLMAERRQRPHDPTASDALRRFAEAIDPQRVVVTFADGDLTQEAAPGAFDVVACHGVLGGVVDDPEQQRRCLEHLLQALAPGGLLSLTSRFREDLRRESLALAREWATRAGLEPLSEGLWRRRPAPA